MHLSRNVLLAGLAAVAVHAQNEDYDEDNDYDNGNGVATTASAQATATGSAASSQCTNGYVCNNAMIQPTEADASTLTYAYAIQNLLVKWYNQYDFSADNFSSLPNADQESSLNGETMAANVAANMAGLKQQAQLGLQAIQQLGDVVGAQMPECDYTLPPGLPNVTQAIMSATLVEATLCGAFIGGADYVYHPAVANLMARMSAEHGIHGSFLHSYTQAVPFSADSQSLTPAFTPDQILSSGSGVGYLGDYIPEGCVAAPSPPCGAEVSFGPLLPTTASMGDGAMSTAPATATAGAGGAGQGGMMGANATMTTPAAGAGGAGGNGMGAAQPTGSMGMGAAGASGSAMGSAMNSYGMGSGASATNSAGGAEFTGAADAPKAAGSMAGALGAVAALFML